MATVSAQLTITPDLSAFRAELAAELRKLADDIDGGKASAPVEADPTTDEPAPRYALVRDRDGDIGILDRLEESHAYSLNLDIVRRHLPALNAGEATFVTLGLDAVHAVTYAPLSEVPA